MSIPRMRMLAGPNGSGKSTLLEYLRRQPISLGYCQNPDLLEKQLHETGQLDLNAVGLRFDRTQLSDFFRKHPLGKSAWPDGLDLRAGVLAVKPGAGGGYFTAMLSDFIRQRWVEAGVSFTFETVMSSHDKIWFMHHAASHGYRTYLYYVCTASALISRERIAVRVAEGGHDVPRNKVERRYVRSLGLLPLAIMQARRAYLFDNSGTAHRLIAEYQEGRLVAAAETLPGWFLQAIPDPARPAAASK